MSSSRILVLITAFACLAAFATPGTAEAQGLALFNAKCVMCHGPEGGGGFAHRSIKGAAASRIQRGINMRPDMAFLSYLSTADINLISAYLATVPPGQKLPRNGQPVTGEPIYRSSCSYCHTIGRGPRVGPDLIGIGNTMSDTWIAAWIAYPSEMVAAGAYSQAKLANYRYVMPDLGHGDLEVWDTTAYIVSQTAAVQDVPPVNLTPAAFDAAKNKYFDRCAGCHGLYRTGATGPNIGQARSQAIGTDGLGAILRYGTPTGMPNFGQSGLLTDAQMTDLAAYLQLPPPDPPPLPMTDIQASWKLIVPPEQRPASPQTTRNWQNFTGVILRDGGQVAVFDADTHEEVVRLNTGFAVHILRTNANGRYFYAIGRDGLVSLIDLWTAVPQIVATVKGCHDGRSVDGSKAPGFEDRYIMQGCYWPPQYVVYDGLTLQPLARNDVPMQSITGETLPENRVAAIVASRTQPTWTIALKESGYVAIIDYSQAGFPIVTKLATEKFLHDGGFDHTGRYFMLAANASNKMVVIDVDNRSYVKSFFTGQVPHPGRGVNWLDPAFGWVNATAHISEGKLAVYGADPAASPATAWSVVRNIALPSAGSLFVKSHPNSPWVFVDMTMSSDPVLQKQVCVISKATGALDHCFNVATNGKATHMEFNQQGTEVWVSDWATYGGIVILDSVTLQEKARIYGLPTPTGKFNVFNTANDIY
jgi:nitrite reductase (NO-forming)/hydroxylamine reductase